MFKQIRFWVGLTAFVTAMGLPLVIRTHAQSHEQTVQLGSAQEVSNDVTHTTQVEPHLLAASPPSQGTLPGRGVASGSVFTRGRMADAVLNFNNGKFSLSLAVPPGTGAQVNYTGTYNRLQRVGSPNSGSFILEGRIRSFASSANNLRVDNTTGTCRIETFDSLVLISSCNTSIRDSATRFQGMEQF